MGDICAYCKEKEEIYIELVESEPCCRLCFHDKKLEYQELTRTDK